MINTSPAAKSIIYGARLAANLMQLSLIPGATPFEQEVFKTKSQQALDVIKKIDEISAMQEYAKEIMRQI